MQTLKPEIRDRIIQAAFTRFFTQGYADANMRDIAAQVGVSVSNLYKYFPNKEEIFSAIVDEYYHQYLKGLKKMLGHQGNDTFDSDQNSKLAGALFETIRLQHREFVILAEQSKGTRYEGFSAEVIRLLEKHIRQGLPERSKQEYIVRIFVLNFFRGITEIARHYKNDAWAKTNLQLLVEYHMAGMASLYK